MKSLDLRTLSIALITVLSTFLLGCGGSSNFLNNVVDTENYEIMTLAKMDENLSTFASLAEMSDLDLKLEYGGPVTVLIPTNDAFKSMPLEEYNFLIDPDNRDELSRFLQRHILPSKVYAIEFNSSQAIETVGEEEITISTNIAGNVINVGGAQIIKSDIEGSNGIIHILNSIVEPSKDVFIE